jgi:hypothetical protein
VRISSSYPAPLSKNWHFWGNNFKNIQYYYCMLNYPFFPIFHVIYQSSALPFYRLSIKKALRKRALLCFDMRSPDNNGR